MEFGKQHDTTDTTDFRIAHANLLRTCYGETGVMDFGLNITLFCITLRTTVYSSLIQRYRISGRGVNGTPIGNHTIRVEWSRDRDDVT